MNPPAATADLVRTVADAIDRVLHDPLRRPAATYRLQFHPRHMTFRDAARLVPYLAELGISHLYASPYLAARSDSEHGYDVVDHSRLDPRLGSDDDYQSLVRALRDHALGQVLDIVPNHMGVATPENARWMDVLENGPSSPWAHYFDIDWNPHKDELRNKILLPLLGEQYGAALEAGQLELRYADGALTVHYFDHILPVEPKSYALVLGRFLEELQSQCAADDEDLLELQSILTALQHLPPYTTTVPDRIQERQREKEIVKSRLRQLTERSPRMAEYVRRCVQAFRVSPDDQRSADALDQLLSVQVYRLSHWKAASDEINYRRFFDINDLAALSMEEPDVFERTHRFVFQLLAHGDVHGLRIDHIDGLFDPVEYLWRLQTGFLQELAAAVYAACTAGGPQTADPPPRAAPSAASWPAWEEVAESVLAEVVRRLGAAPSPDAGDSLRKSLRFPPAAAPLYVVAEKILEPEEPLPTQWPIAGTTGYDFLNRCLGLFVDADGLRDVERAYSRFIGVRMDFRDVVYECKLLILRVAMSSELQLLAYRLNRLSEKHRRTRDFTFNNLRTALREILACFPVYRTYIGAGGISERDRRFVHQAVAQAKRRNPAMDAAVFDFVRDVLLLEQPPQLDAEGRRERDFFVGRFQQVTSPVMAKGVEDTASYRYVPLVALNEVGGAPARPPADVGEFHRFLAARLATHPWSMNAATTHDTKRSEDVRARIAVLSEVPHRWRQAVAQWSRLNRRYVREVHGEPAPSRNDEYLFYQTLVGIWPLEPPRGEQLAALVARMQQYMEKATREAKWRTSWLQPDENYDAAVRQFVAAALRDDPKNRFLAALERFHARVVDWGLYTALSQKALQLLAPGVPDIYQGQELWDFSLVDPDNRRPVDFEQRRCLLAELRRQSVDAESRLALARRLARSPRDPRIKLFVTSEPLHLRRRAIELFVAGQYVPLQAAGAKAQHVVAFALREADGAVPPGRQVIVVVPRWLAALCPPDEEEAAPPPPLGEAIWADTWISLPSLISGSTASLAEGGAVAAQRAGSASHHSASFAQDAAVATVAPSEAAVPRLRDIFTGRCFDARGGSLRLADVLADFPLAALEALGHRAASA
jgi:(1->4)-alpha-D-glucan 1-alpha-D-glucosylmutase